MAGNVFAEDMLTLEVPWFDPKARSVTVVDNRNHWTYNSNLIGHIMYAMMVVPIKPGFLMFNFNKNYTFAMLDLRLAPTFLGINAGQWGFRKEDKAGIEWSRGHFEGEKYVPEYTVFKVLDKDCKKLPAFDLMVKSAKENTPVKDLPIKYKMDPDSMVTKTYHQLVNSDPGWLSWAVAFPLSLYGVLLLHQMYLGSDFYSSLQAGGGPAAE